MPTKDNTGSLPFEPREDGGFLYLLVRVDDVHGMHARPSASFFEKVLMPHDGKLDLAFQINEEGAFVPIRSVFDLMALGLEQGTRLNVRLAYRDKALDEQVRREKNLAIARTVHQVFLDMNPDA